MSEDERFAYGEKKICPYGNILFAPCQMREYPMPREEEEDYVTLLCGGFFLSLLIPLLNHVTVKKTQWDRRGEDRRG